MQERSFIWGRLGKQYRAVERRIDWLWVIILLLAALLLCTINLGGFPLRDWDEGTVAQVAREISLSPAGSMHWLFPTLGGEPYHNKPPLMHLLIAWAYSVGDVNEWTARLPGAILTATSVPLVYGIAREIFRQRFCAIYSALVYLTMLPVMRHGRLAMLDGAAICFFLVMMLCVLRSRRDLRYCLGIGIGLGLICLTKGMLGILLAAIAFAFLLWDTPRILSSWYLWLGILIGAAPVAFWYGAQWWHYRHGFLNTGVVDQSLSRIWKPVDNNSGPPWYYLLEILKYGWPWLLFLPRAFRLTWENRNLSWAKLILVWSCVYLVSVSLMGTKLPWYILPIYPSLALAVGAQIAEIEDLPLTPSYTRPWVAGLAILAIAACGINIYFTATSQAKTELQIILAAVAGTMALAAILAERGDRQFIKVLLWGTYFSLLLLMKSPYWIWELEESYPVKPVAAMIQQGTPENTKIYTSFKYHRPSLNFYSQRQVIPADNKKLREEWEKIDKPYFLLDKKALESLPLHSMKQIHESGDWTLVTKSTF
ncbi:MAG: glycosyltransferase family 39 protein [Nostocaceae cyanobacterium]|nr:glycosyltransferase family 39 protein [Nostocaceae cyanobacterium]